MDATAFRYSGGQPKRQEVVAEGKPRKREDHSNLEEESHRELALEYGEDERDHVAHERGGGHEEREIREPPSDARGCFFHIALHLSEEQPTQQEEERARDENRGNRPTDTRKIVTHRELLHSRVGEEAVDVREEEDHQTDDGGIERREGEEMEKRIARPTRIRRQGDRHLQCRSPDRTGDILFLPSGGE